MKALRIIAPIVMLSSAAPMMLHAQTLRWPELARLVAPTFDAANVQADDLQRAAAGELELYARTLPLQASTWSNGSWAEDGQDLVCRFRVSSPGAQAIELMLEQMDVPQGATIRMLALNGQPLSNAMELPIDAQESSSPMVYADDVVLEYRQPLDAAFEGRFAIGGVAHAYRHVLDAMREGPCHVNVACAPESNGWDDVIAATVRISVVTPQGSGWCTGTLVNNVRQDCTPYILTAFHCGRTSTTAQLNQYKFYFNFQYATCAGGAYSTSQFITGSQRLAFSDDYVVQYQGLGGSDFMLLRTTAAIPESFQPFWAGWDATSIANVSQDGVCIHHPTGAPKRISSYTQTLTTGHPMTSSGLMSHYRLLWAATPNGHGITELGSSGAGLFKPSANGPVLIGTLTGSSSGMTCSNNGGTSYFGKMSYHWTNNPNAANLKLKNWLDPDGTGTLVLSGSAQPCAVVSSVKEPSTMETFTVWPNPVSDVLRIEPVGTYSRKAMVIATDMAGHLVGQWSLTSLPTTLDVSRLASGMHVFSLIDPDNGPPQRTKVVIEH